MPDRPEVPRWEPPARGRQVPRWEPPPPEPDVPRWQPPPSGPRASGSRRREPDAGFPPRRPRRPVPAATAALQWWARHPWVIVWAGIFLAPPTTIALRVLDESALQALVTPLAWMLATAFAGALLLGLLVSASRSLARMTIGGAAALCMLGLLLWPMTQVDLGRTACPARAGPDLGVQAAAAALEGWQARRPDAGPWRDGEPSAAWRQRSGAVTLLDYQRVDSGCFERAAPIRTTRAWHEFRVTVREGERAPLSKVVVVQTVRTEGGWKIASIEGPLP